MSLLPDNPPWYAAGLAFECVQCGRCCAGPEEGYVWATVGEIARIAEFLGIGEKEMYRRYVRKVGRRFTIVEDKVSHDCIFLSPGAKPGGGKGCRIYSVRPTQCRTWPFWSHNLASPHSWAMANLRCPGINRGPRFATDEIESRRQATRE